MAPVEQSARLRDLLAESNELVGAAIAVVSSDGKTEVATIGCPDVDEGTTVTATTPFSLWSTSKLLTATLACQLVDQDVLSLDEPISKWYPEASSICPDPLPTVRQLLSHSSGVIDLFEPIADAETLIAKIAAHGPNAKPGEIMSYSNAGYALVGALLTKVTGEDWCSLVRSRILKPLGLTKVQLGDEETAGLSAIARNHHFHPDGTPYVKEVFPRKLDMMAAAGSTAAAPIDEAAILLGAILLGTHPGLLSEEIRAEMQTLQIPMPGTSTFCAGWGLGWSIIDPSNGLVGHMGATSAYMVGSKKLGKAVCFLSNTDSFMGNKRGGAIVGRDLAFKALGLEIPQEPAASPEPNSVPTGLSGRYASPLFSFDITEKDSKVLATATFTDQPCELQHVGGYDFSGRVGTLQTEFNFIGAEGDQPPRYLHVALRAVARAEKV